MLTQYSHICKQLKLLNYYCTRRLGLQLITILIDDYFAHYFNYLNFYLLFKTK